MTSESRPGSPGLAIDLALVTLLVASVIQFSGRLPPAGLRWLAVLIAVLAFGAAWVASRIAKRHDRLSGSCQSPRLRQFLERMPIRSFRFAALAIVATAFLGWRIESQLATRLAPALEGQVIELDVMIDRIGDRGSFGERLLATVEHCRPVDVGGVSCDNLERVQLAWSLERLRDRDDDARSEWPRPGERWRIDGRARRPSAPVNVGSFDLELRLLEEGLGAIVRVRERRRLADPPGWLALWWAAPGVAIERVRDGLRATVEARAAALARQGGAPPWASLALVNALALGDQRGLPSSDWALFSRTGVSHLMAISGLHVTLLAWLGSLVVSAALKALAARRFRPVLALTRRCGRPRLVAATTVLLAFGYALLSGWGIASQRTCWMLLVASAVAFSARASGPITATVVATFPIIVLDPWAVSAAGFWLSFGAVLAIIWQAAGRPNARAGSGPDRRAKAGVDARPDPRAKAGVDARPEATADGPARTLEASLPAAAPAFAAGERVATLRRGLRNLVDLLGSQWAATLALLPLTIVLFASASIIGPLVNLFAIPWVSFVVTPAALLLTLTAGLPWPEHWPLDPWAAGWWLTSRAIDAMMATLRLADGWSLASVRIAAPAPALLIAALLGAIWLLAPRGTGRRWVGLAGLLPLLFAGRLVPSPDQLRITAFDIGLGSAVLVETADARILIDAGGGLPGAQAAGPAASTIVPALARRGIDRIDALIVSHRDREHAAGVATVVASLRPTWLVSGFDPQWLPIDPGALKWQACVSGERLEVGALMIEALWPPSLARTRLEAGDNGRSCVVRIRHPAGAIVAAGDLPLRQEARLLAAASRHRSDDRADDRPDIAAGPLAADVLIVPGQGSRSAAGETLVKAVSPTVALIQTARAQRQRIVHPTVLDRLDAIDAIVLRTDRDGAVTVTLREAASPEIHRVRLDSPPYWRIVDAPSEVSSRHQMVDQGVR